MGTALVQMITLQDTPRILIIRMTPSFLLLSKVALVHGITIVGGSMPERRNHQLYNTCCVFGPDGNLKAKHSKVYSSHLILK